jgi:hypothetical protein
VTAREHIDICVALRFESRYVVLVGSRDRPSIWAPPPFRGDEARRSTIGHALAEGVDDAA